MNPKRCTKAADLFTKYLLVAARPMGYRGILSPVKLQNKGKTKKALVLPLFFVKVASDYYICKLALNAYEVGFVNYN